MLKIIAVPPTRKKEQFLSKLNPKFKRGIKNGSLKCGEAIINQATQKLISGTRTGRKYPQLPNRSSAPGEYPKNQSGRLKDSLYAKASFSELKIGAKAKHGLYLEFGTSRMSARPNAKNPWLQMAMRLQRRNIRNYLTREVLKEIRC